MVNINLLPAGQRRQASSGSQPWLIAAGALAVLTVLGIIGMEVYYNSQIGGLEDDLSSLQGEIQALEPDKQEYDSLVARKSELEQVTEVARTLRDQKTYWSNDLAAFTAQLPAGDGLALTSLQMQPAAAGEQNVELQQGGLAQGATLSRTIDLEGIARSQQAVIDMLNAFENNDDFGVAFQGMQRTDTPDGNEEYTFNANVGIAKAAPPSEATDIETIDATGTTEEGATPPAAPTEVGGS